MAVDHLPRCVGLEITTCCGGPCDRHGPFTLTGCQPFAPNDAWLVHGGVDRMGSLRGAIRVRTARLRTIHHCPRLASPAIFAARRAATGGPSSDLGGDNSGRDRLLVSGHLGRNPHYSFHNNRRGAAPRILWLSCALAGKPWRRARGAMGRTHKRREVGTPGSGDHHAAQYGGELLHCRLYICPSWPARGGRGLSKAYGPSGSARWALRCSPAALRQRSNSANTCLCGRS